MEKNNFIIKIERKELITKLGCNLVCDKFLEEVLVKNYTYNRKQGTPYVKLLSEVFLLSEFNTTPDELNINSIISKDKMLSIVYSTLEKLDVILLMNINNLNFKEILFKCMDKKVYEFEVVYG